MSLPIKVPAGNELFWMALVALIVALFAIYLSNTNDKVGDVVKSGWFN